MDILRLIGTSLVIALIFNWLLILVLEIVRMWKRRKR